MRKKNDLVDSSPNSHSALGCADGDDRLMTVPEAAVFLHISPGTLFHWISSENRGVPVIRFSARCVRFSKTALLKWLDGLTHSAGSPLHADVFRNRPTRAFRKSNSGEQK
jgi:hypothetical protein